MADAWTKAEDDIMRAHYPAGRAQACAILLPHRSVNAIYVRARDLRIQHRHPSSRPVDNGVALDGRLALLKEFNRVSCDRILREARRKKRDHHQETQE